MAAARLTPSQTIGPFFANGLRWAVDATTRAPTAAEVTIDGRLLDADGNPVGDGLLEIWQPAAAAGAPGGWQRVPTDVDGQFRFRLDRAAGHAGVMVFARGLLKATRTRVHLVREHVPTAVPADRVHTLVAQPTADPARFAWDVRLGGPKETVFFEI